MHLNKHIFGVNNFRIPRPMRLISFSEHWKFNADSKEAKKKKMKRKIYCFLDHLIRIGNGKFPLFLRVYS